MALRFIHTAFENASPANWRIAESGGSAEVELLYDHEYDSPNRAAGHWHLCLEGDAGTAARVKLRNFENIWNGRQATEISSRTGCLASSDGRSWRRVAAQKTTDNGLEINARLEKERLYLARIEPYRISDLQRMLAGIKNHPLVAIEPIGQTVEGRELELIRVGREETANRVFLRARAHPWETGGNFCAQGLVRSLLRNTKHAARCLEAFSVYILPIANMDGVARGYTRFNVAGMDLNRNWSVPADPRRCPENRALEQWIEAMQAAGMPLGLAIDLHNDAYGRLHVSRPEAGEKQYLAAMNRFEAALTGHTWFTEGRTPPGFRNPGSFGSSLWERYGVPAVVLELNSNWIAGLQRQPFGADWELLGSQMGTAFYSFFQ